MKHLPQAQEADEDFGTARLVAAHVKKLVLGCRSSRKSLIELLAGKMRCVCFASGAVKRSSAYRASQHRAGLHFRPGKRTEKGNNCSFEINRERIIRADGTVVVLHYSMTPLKYG